MKPYRTLATVRLFSGLVGLTEKQVKWRASCLKKIKDDVFEIVDEVTLKAGEVIGLADPPKPYRKKLECLEPEPPPAEAEIEFEIKEDVKVATKPAAKKRKYVKRKA